ncbi:membrane anchored protein in chemotaxis locus [Shewanella olleyana]|uniref:membrane anchored protein in chemotaxis locus n=1 Tax=Shewanella olleyana TaxID=135626 RepID=UPI00200DC963|nr:membrane anchored protein in chemotaxis locus [Shewanella olleyana]MCL1066527.1 membrane anchored protein in chemotaxis locus [Shewanella olleyana]
MSTQHMFVVFILIIAVICLGSLYFDLAKKNRELAIEVNALKGSQVLLMVPDDQAAQIANWLAKYPEQTQAMAARAAKGEDITLAFGPGSEVVSSDTLDNTLMSEQAKNSALSSQAVTENAQGVKVITLPHGGIRVTTRESETPKNNK